MQTRRGVKVCLIKTWYFWESLKDYFCISPTRGWAEGWRDACDKCQVWGWWDHLSHRAGHTLCLWLKQGRKCSLTKVHNFSLIFYNLLTESCILLCLTVAQKRENVFVVMFLTKIYIFILILPLARNNFLFVTKVHIFYPKKAFE